MKRFLTVLLALCAPLAFSQEAKQPRASTNLVERVQAPTYSDMYCAGFITNESHAKGSFLVGGASSGMTGDVIYVDAGLHIMA